MLAMLVVATALTRISFVHSRPYVEGDDNAVQSRGLFSEDDMTPDFTEQLGSHDHDGDIKKRNEAKPEKYNDPPTTKNDEKSITTTDVPLPVVTVVSVKDEGKKRNEMKTHNDEVDVVDREDHVTQYLADLLVNTDSEITSLQATDTEEDRENLEVREDQFFAFLTGQEKTLEVEGAWSRPIGDDVKNDDKYLPNLLIDDE